MDKGTKNDKIKLVEIIFLILRTKWFARIVEKSSANDDDEDEDEGE